MSEYNEYITFCINNIKERLTGDSAKDMEYLMACSEKYKNDEESETILAEIAAMMYELLDDEDKKNVNSRFEQLQQDSFAKYEEVKELVQKGDYLAAKEKMDILLTSVEGSYEETDTTIFISFNHIMEFYMYNVYFKPEKQVVATDIPFNEYYRTLGVICSLMEAYDDAKTALFTALKWNPVDLDTYLAIGEIYKHTGELDEFLKITNDSYRYCCTRATMARFYRNVGYYYMSKYNPNLAVALFNYSNVYFLTDNANEEIRFLETALEEKMPEMSVKELQEMLTKEDIKLGPDSDTIGIIYRVGQLMMEEERFSEARDCFSIVYDITMDEEAGTILDQLENMAE